MFTDLDFEEKKEEKYKDFSYTRVFSTCSELGLLFIPVHGL